MSYNSSAQKSSCSQIMHKASGVDLLTTFNTLIFSTPNKFMIEHVIVTITSATGTGTLNPVIKLLNSTSDLIMNNMMAYWTFGQVNTAITDYVSPNFYNLNYITRNIDNMAIHLDITAATGWSVLTADITIIGCEMEVMS